MKAFRHLVHPAIPAGLFSLMGILAPKEYEWLAILVIFVLCYIPLAAIYFVCQVSGNISEQERKHYD